MEENEQYLFFGNYKFIKCSSFDELKISANNGNDLRFFSNKLEFGLHISHKSVREEQVFSILKDSIRLHPGQRLIILYISDISIKKIEDFFFDIDIKNSFGNLKYLKIWYCKSLIELELPSLNSIEELIISECRLLTTFSIKSLNSKLKKLELFRNSLVSLDLEKLESLEYLNVRSNRIVNLDISQSPNLKYLFAEGNPLKTIRWPKSLRSISLIHFDSNIEMNEFLQGLHLISDGVLRSQLNAYLRQLHGEGEFNEIRLKLMFIGNTTAGKSTLRRILQSATGHEEADAQRKELSTHGVKVFTQNIDSVILQGFDFGGQDYFHSTHLPFMDHNTLNVLVYGYYGKNDDLGQEDAYKFGLKEVDGRMEILYPISYWIGSLKKNDILEFKSPNEIGEYLSNREVNGESIDGLKVFPDEAIPKIYLNDTDLELVHNKRDNVPIQHLNNLEIKNTSNVNVGDIVSFDFYKQAKEVKNWILNKIINHAAGRPLLYTDKRLIDWLEKEMGTVFSFKELYKKFPESKNYKNLAEFNEALKRIHKYNFGYYFETQNKNKESFFIRDLEEFSNWIHQKILTPELLKVSNGYFNTTDLDNSFPFRKVISFLEDNEVIFKVNDVGQERWVAPSYLPEVKNKAEVLLLASFGLPETIFKFKSFFHSNIILKIIAKFKDELVLDPVRKEYLLWRNKVLLYQEGSCKEKAFLLIELKHPKEQGFSGEVPELSISRNASGFINDSLFGTVFKFLHEQLKIFTPEVSIKTRYNDYIPYKTLFQQNSFEGKTKSSLIYFNQTFYPIHSFKHYLGDYRIEPTKIFIGYSKGDVEYVDELLLHLNPYQKQGEVIVFHDRDMRMGDSWDEELKHQLRTSDVFVCLISPNMLNTAYVVDLELPLAHSLNKKILPIVIHECNWTYLNLNDGLNFLSDSNAYKKGKVLSQNKSDRQTEWKDIAYDLTVINKNHDETNLSNSPSSSDEHVTGYNQENGGK